MSATTKQLREAYVQGALAQFSRVHEVDVERIKNAATYMYPTPTITRPRVVVIVGDSMEYRLVDGVIQVRQQGYPHRWETSVHTVERIRALNGLLLDPTETVEVGE